MCKHLACQHISFWLLKLQLCFRYCQFCCQCYGWVIISIELSTEARAIWKEQKCFLLLIVKTMLVQMCDKAFSSSPSPASSELRHAPQNISLRWRTFLFLQASLVFRIATILIFSNDFGHSVMKIWSICFPSFSVVCRDAAFPFYGLYVNLSHETFLIILCDICQVWMIGVFLLVCCSLQRWFKYHCYAKLLKNLVIPFGSNSELVE